MLRWLLRVFGYCDHPHRYFARDADRVLFLVCEVCGHRVPVLRKNAAERHAQTHPPP